MEDYRDRIAVVIAGYNEKMDDFLSTNEGLQSRFTNFYNFKNYSSRQLTEIFDIMMKESSYSYSNHTKKRINHLFQLMINKNNPEYFGNAREVRNVCGTLKKIQHKRIFCTPNFQDNDNDYFTKITNADINQLYKKYELKEVNDQKVDYKLKQT